MLYFRCCFYVPCTFHCVLSHFTFHVSLSSLLITLKSKRCESDVSALFYKRLTLGQSNVKAVLTKIEEPDTLSNILNIIFQNCCYFSLRFTLKGVLLKYKQLKLKDTCNTVHFYDKDAG